MNALNEKKVIRTFKRFETDAEFKQRLRATYAIPAGALDFLALNGLDEWAWGQYKVQRRIIDVSE